MSESNQKSESHHNHEGDQCSCHSQPTNPSVHQSLDELSFERSIFQAAIDNNVDKIDKFSRAVDFNVNATDNYGYTALHYASRNGNVEAAKCLVKLGANVNLPTSSLRATALHRAITANKIEMVRYLLSVGADPHVKDGDGLSPIDRAEKDHHVKIMEILQKS